MAIKTINLPSLAAVTGMYAFVYRPDTQVLLNTGGDALSLVSGAVDRFQFDLAEDVSSYDYVEVRIHDSNTPTQANLLWYASLALGDTVCQDAALPIATKATQETMRKLCGFTLSWVAGAIANAQSSTETTVITIDGVTYTVTGAGITSTGNRSAPSLTES